MKKLISPFAFLALIFAATPAAADAPSYATTNRETIGGTIEAVTGKYTLTLNDDRGYFDNVTLHDGTVITPTGTRLYARQSVTIIGHAAGKTFDADEIDVDPASIAPELPIAAPYSSYDYPTYGDPYARYYYGAPYYNGAPYYYGAPYYFDAPYSGLPYYYGAPYYFIPNVVPNSGKQNYMPPPFWNTQPSTGTTPGQPRYLQPVTTRPETRTQPSTQQPSSHGSNTRTSEPAHRSHRQ